MNELDKIMMLADKHATAAMQCAHVGDPREYISRPRSKEEADIQMRDAYRALRDSLACSSCNGDGWVEVGISCSACVGKGTKTSGDHTHLLVSLALAVEALDEIVGEKSASEECRRIASHELEVIAYRGPSAKELLVPDDWTNPEVRLPEKNVPVLVHVRPGETRIDQWVEFRESLVIGTPSVITGEGWSEHETYDVVGWKKLPVMQIVQADGQ